LQSILGNRSVHLAGGGGGGIDLANPTQAKMPAPRITHPKTSYQKSLSFFFFLDCCKV
jgi:hypothetical protein